MEMCVIQAKEHHDEDQRNDGYHYDHHRGYVEKRSERFSDNDRELIVKYYKHKHKKFRHVDIVIGEPASPEIFMPLPSDLIPLLPPPPPGFQLFMAGDQIVRVEKRSHRVVDCVPIPGIVPPPPPPLPSSPPPPPPLFFPFPMPRQ
jgi:hypothetical protein